MLALDILKVIFMPKTELWETALEDALTDSTPEGVLVILQKLDGWLVGYCITCGTYNDTCGGKVGCNCSNKGSWNK